MTAKKPYRGKQIIPVRLPPEVLERLDAYCEATGAYRNDGQVTRTEFVRSAVLEKLAHLERSKRKRKPKLKGEQLADAALAALTPPAIASM